MWEGDEAVSACVLSEADVCLSREADAAMAACVRCVLRPRALLEWQMALPANETEIHEEQIWKQGDAQRASMDA